MNPEPPKLETTAAAVAPGQLVYPKHWAPRRRRRATFAKEPWIAHGHDREGCLVISRGRSVQRLSPGTLVLAQTAPAPLPA